MAKYPANTNHWEAGEGNKAVEGGGVHMSQEKADYSTPLYQGLRHTNVQKLLQDPPDCALHAWYSGGKSWNLSMREKEKKY